MTRCAKKIYHFRKKSISWITKIKKENITIPAFESASTRLGFSISSNFIHPLFDYHIIYTWTFLTKKNFITITPIKTTSSSASEKTNNSWDSPKPVSQPDNPSLPPSDNPHLRPSDNLSCDHLPSHPKEWCHPITLLHKDLFLVNKNRNYHIFVDAVH